MFARDRNDLSVRANGKRNRRTAAKTTRENFLYDFTAIMTNCIRLICTYKSGRPRRPRDESAQNVSRAKSSPDLCRNVSDGEKLCTSSDDSAMIFFYLSIDRFAEERNFHCSRFSCSNAHDVRYIYISIYLHFTKFFSLR